MLVTCEVRVGYVCTVCKPCVGRGSEWHRVISVLIRCVLSESE